MKLTKFRTAFGLAVLALASSSALAGMSVSSAFPGGPLIASDNSAEYLIDRGVQNGTLDVGDSLRGIFSIDNVTGSGPQVAIGAGTAYNELTGIFQVQVLSKVAAGGGRFNYTFGFDAGFGQGAGVLGVLYDDAAQDFKRANCGGANNFAACEATATGGNIWATVGFGADGFWSAANAVETPAVGGNVDTLTPLGQFSMALDFLTNNTGYEWNNVSCTDLINLSSHTSTICGLGSLYATGRNLQGGTVTPYDLFDDVNFRMNRVPEPGSLALVGLALVGLGVARSKKRAA